MKEEKLGETKIHTNSKAASFIENFWYHYKWPTIIVCFFVIVFTICTAQMCSKKSYDMTIVYAGPYNIDAERANDIKGVFDFTIAKDYDGDGEKSTQLVSYLIYTQEQVEKIEAEESVFVDRAYIANENQNFFNFASTEAGICFLDPSLYQSLREADRLVNISETFGVTPEGLVDGCGVEISKTALYAEYAVLREMPSDTVVCMLRKQLTKKDAAYANELETFKAILNFGTEN
jgi:hypothetical protein